MLRLRKVAVTGGLSCGKSSVCRILKELGAYVISADTIVHQLLSSDTNLGHEIVRLLGSSVLVDQEATFIISSQDSAERGKTGSKRSGLHEEGMAGAAASIISSQDSAERGKTGSKRSGLHEEGMAKAMSDEEDRSGQAAAGRIPDEMMEVAAKAMSDEEDRSGEAAAGRIPDEIMKIADQKIDRKKIAEIVFRDFERLKALEALIHPIVYRELNKYYLEQQNLPQPPPLFVAEIPLLFESNGQKEYDTIVVVTAPSDICFKRFEKTSGKGLEEYERRAARQLPIEEKARRADYIIHNNGSLSDLYKNTVELYQILNQH